MSSATLVGGWCAEPVVADVDAQRVGRDVDAIATIVQRRTTDRTGR